ncbi:uncharacterized protein LOC128896174, partial [Hylaeus anthracinus]|uniref:uncharacterized protein LOC128896174 n=1 Tax=Hylaeus anthracinus TaxID=313031 RepID=UPI0023B95B46
VHNRPSEKTIRNLVITFDETGSIHDKPKSGRPKTVLSNENIPAVRKSVANDPSTSIPRRSQELSIFYGSLWQILHEDLHLHAFKIELTQELKERDHLQRRNFTNWLSEHRSIDALFSRNIIFSDEAHFTLDGHVNKQNCRIWGDENSRAIKKKSLHSKKVTVWCGFWSKGVIGPFFFENENEGAVIVNGARHNEMIIDYLWLKLNGID